MSDLRLFMRDLDERRVPLSAGMIARWMMKAGMDSEAAEAAANEVVEGLSVLHADEALASPDGHTIRRDEVFLAISDVLLAYGLVDVERRVRIRRWVRTSGQPFVVAIGGSSGVGKSTVSQEVADRLGISVVISTDQVRAVIRSVLAPDLLPALHQSSFSAAKMLRSNLTGNRLLFAFEEQARIVQHGAAALARRSVKEGQQVMINGVHVVPGLMEVEPALPLLTYVLTVASPEEHRGRFIRPSFVGWETYLPLVLVILLTTPLQAALRSPGVRLPSAIPSLMPIGAGHDPQCPGPRCRRPHHSSFFAPNASRPTGQPDPAVRLHRAGASLFSLGAGPDPPLRDRRACR